MSYLQQKIAPVREVTWSRLVLAPECGARLIQTPRWRGEWHQAPVMCWDMMVWSALLEAVLSPRSVCITDLSALTAEQIVRSINHDGMGCFYNRLAKIFVHKDNVGTITPREELTIGSVGAEVHILSSDYAKAAGYGDIRGAWQVMLREVADLSVTLSDQESLPSALAAGVRSSYDEIILIDDLPSLHVPGSELKLRGYKCK